MSGLGATRATHTGAYGFTAPVVVVLVVLHIRIQQPGLPSRMDANGVRKFRDLAPVLSVVISVFMLGLSLGAWLGGRFIKP